MKVVIQRVLSSSVSVQGEVVGSIGPGMNILVGITHDDSEEDIEWLCKKIVNLRIFDDESGVMNRSILDTGGDILVISQFTLMASTKKGNRPSWIQAAPPETSIPLYQSFLQRLELYLQKKVECGIFGADMRVQIENNGPVTLIIDSKNKV
jgi:D-tyrosyl-tRNA(Tyr) deacylase